MNYRPFVALVVFLTLLTNQTLKAQVDVTAQPLGLLFGTLNVSADFAVSESFSVEGIIGFTSRSDSGTDADTGDPYDYDYTGIPITAVGKYYLKPRRGADRFYLSAFLRYINRSVNFTGGSDNADLTWSRFGLGFGVGTKIVSAKGVVLDLGLGIGRAFHNKITYEENGDREEVDWPGIMFLPRLAVGYRFGG
ncbi:MAG: DUF3575 domain-containing protein [Bacteroidetes bacterium]|nr:MAG: DUF3575 domain-containing protein [Bacteroidota bacterium]